jgi:hypothetical protein
MGSRKSTGKVLVAPAFRFSNGRKMKKTPRNNFALSAKSRRSKQKPHKGTPKGGSKNEQSELLSEQEEPEYFLKQGEWYIQYGEACYGPFLSEKEAREYLE